VDKLAIEGGLPLAGEVAISGAKNAALPILCAGLLSADPLTLTNLPHLKDVATMLRLLAQMGVGVTLDGVDGVVLEGAGLNNPVAPYEMVKTMRASVLVLAPWWPATAKPRSPCPAVAPSAPGRWTSTSRACRPWGPKSASSRATCTPRSPLPAAVSRAPASAPTWSP